MRIPGGCCGSEDAPIITVLSLSCWWAVSIEGMVPDIARGRVVIVGGGGRRWARLDEGCGGCERERQTLAGARQAIKLHNPRPSDQTPVPSRLHHLLIISVTLVTIVTHHPLAGPANPGVPATFVDTTAASSFAPRPRRPLSAHGSRGHHQHR